MRTIRSLSVVAAIVAAGALIVSGCGSHSASDGTSTTAANDRTSALLKFTECMRTHGIDMPDPNANGQIVIDGSSSYDPSSAAFRAAQRKCGNGLTLGSGSFGRADQSAVQEQLLRFTRCLRSHGVKAADPTTGSNGQFSLPVVDFDNPRTRAAMTACARLLPAPPAPSGS